MFEVSKAAAACIKDSAFRSDAEELALRVAVMVSDDGSFDYRLGFDEIGEKDTLLNTGGVDVVIANVHKALLNGTKLDYVELEPGEFTFIFINPNDPNYSSPTE